MKLADLTRQAGTVRVQLVPLLLLIGAATGSGETSYQIESMIELLDPEDDNG